MPKIVTLTASSRQLIWQTLLYLLQNIYNSLDLKCQDARPGGKVIKLREDVQGHLHHNVT